MSPVKLPVGARSCSRSLLLSATALLALPATAQAQSVNHAELEQLFGEPVTTSVTGKPQRASDTPASVVIITREDIRRSPARDIVGVIGAYAGIDVGRWTAGQSDVSIRGGNQPFNARLLVLVNGRQVYLDHYGSTDWQGIGVQLEEIQQIEVVRGPNSALFGFNAVSGVINIITIDPLQTQRVSTTVEAGPDGYRRASASAAIKLDDSFALRLSGGYGEEDELAPVRQYTTSIGDTSPDPHHLEVAGELYGKLGERTAVTLSATRTNTHRADINPIMTAGEGENRFTSLGGEVSHDAGWSLLSGRIYQNQVDITAPVANFPVTYELQDKVLVASAGALFRVGTDDTLRAGAEFRDNRFTSSPGLPGTTRYNVYAVNGMWERAFGDALTFTLAGRLDHLKIRQEGLVDQPSFFTQEDYDRSITEWSLNSAVRVRLDDATSVRVAAARGVQAPSLFSLAARLTLPLPGLPFPLVNAGDPSIRPAIIRSAEVGLDRALEAIDGRVELTAFYNHTHDIIGTPGQTTAPVVAPPDYPYILVLTDNVGSFEAYGVEASLSGRLGQGLSWLANYTWTRAEQDIAGNGEAYFNWPVLLDRTTPEHKIKAQVSYERGPWLASLAARYTSGIQQMIAIYGPLEAVDVASSLVLDAKIGWKASDHLTFELAGENLTEAGGAYLSFFAAERRVRAVARVTF